MRTCRVCSVEKELEEFVAEPKSKEGRMRVCKACNNEATRAKRARRIARDPVGERARDAEKARAWRAANPERSRELQRRHASSESRTRWEAENADRLAELHRAWKLANPDKVREYGQRKRDRMAEAVANGDPEAIARREETARRMRESQLKRNYGITKSDYDALLERQHGVCAISGCGSAKRLVVDHCHTTGAVRGILCNACNHTLGRLGDTADGVRASAASMLLYLSATEGQTPRPRTSFSPAFVTTFASPAAPP